MLFLAYLTLYATVITAFFVIGLLVLIRQKSPMHRNFAIFSFIVGLWQLLELTAQVLYKHHSLAILLFRISVAVATPMVLSLLFFTLSYTKRKIRVVPLTILGMAMVTLVFLSKALEQARISRVSLDIRSVDFDYGLALALNGVCAIYILVLLFMYYRSGEKIHERRAQARTLLLAIGQATAIILFFSVYTTGSYAQLTVPLACLITVVLVAYAIAYRGLFDIHFFVVRATAYLVTLFVMTFLLIVPVVLIFGHFLDFHPNPKQFALVVLLSVCVLYILQYIRQLFDKLTTKIFFRHYYDPQEIFDKLSNVLVRTADISVVRSSTANILSEALKPHLLEYALFTDPKDKGGGLAKTIRDNASAGSSMIMVDEIEGRDKHLVNMLRDEGIALAVKLRTTHEDLGYMVLGHKQSGEIYTSRDERLLSAAADEIAISLQNAIRFEEIQRFNVTLQQKVDEATRKLRNTNDKLRTLDQTKDDFISMASHQLRTPLTSVKGYVSMVIDGDAGPINPMQRKLLDQSFTSAQRMVYLIADLLNISRLKTGKFVIETSPTNLAQITKDEISQLVETAKSRGLELTYDKPLNFPTYMLDTVKIRQVIMNFVDNAIYYTPSGGHIHIELQDKPKSIELRVIDDGIGVPRSLQHHLFSKFYRAPNAQKARPDGTGLGLFMAKKVIIAQGGALIFESTEGKGSVFGFSFAKSHLALPPAKPAKTLR